MIQEKNQTATIAPKDGAEKKTKRFPKTVQEKIDFAAALKAEGNTFYKSKRFKKARACYAKMLLYITGLPDSKSPLAQYDSREKSSSEQENSAAKLLLAAHNNLAQCSLKLNKASDAKSYCEKVLRVDPSNTKAHCRMADALLRLGDLDGAKDHIDKVLEAEKDSKAAKSLRKKHREKMSEYKKKMKSKFKKGFFS